MTIFLKIFFLLSVYLYSLYSFAFSSECLGKNDLNLEDLYFEEVESGRFSISSGTHIFEDITAELEFHGGKTLLNLIARDKDNTCLLEEIHLNVPKICSKGQWRLRRRPAPSDPQWSVIGRDATVEDSADITDSLICGTIVVDGVSKIAKSVILERSQLNLPPQDMHERTYNSEIKNSVLNEVHTKGSIQANNLNLIGAKFTEIGDLVCDTNRCYYRKDPCKDGKRLYSFPNLPLSPDETWWDIFNFPMPQNNFVCESSIAEKAEFRADYTVQGYSPAIWRSTFSNPLESYWPEASLQYLGCTYDGSTSKSLYRYNTIDPFFSLIPQGTPAVVTAAFCTEAINSIQEDLYAELAEVHRGSEQLSPGYITIRGAPYCYRYKVIQFTPTSHRVIEEDLIAKYEECSECAKGKVLINNQCACPSGYVDIGGTCKRPSGCETRQDYWNGLCICPKPYLNLDVNGREYYSCSEPGHTNVWNPQATKVEVPEVKGDFTNLGCKRDENGIMKFEFNYKVTKLYAATLDLALFCSGKRGAMRAGSTGSFIMTWSFNETEREANFKIPHIGDCYEYKLRLMERNSANYYLQEHDIQLSYSGCQN